MLHYLTHYGNSGGNIYLSFMNKKLSICLILSVLPFFYAITLTPLDAAGDLRQNHISANVPFEKVYLSFDRPDYFSGDDLWFKAYLTDAQSGLLSSRSSCLYVELISPDSEILQQCAILIIDGLGHGDFHLNDSLPSGKYQVRAYTRWMRNFDELLFFTREIRIDNVTGPNSSSETYKNQQADAGIEIQFFPEGGALIDDVYSTVGFKAVSSSGSGCGIKGVIMSGTGDTVTDIESSHLGMGSFKFKPRETGKYYASVISEKGVRLIKYLPEILQSGYVLEVSDLDKDNFMVTVKTNPLTLQNNPDEELNIIASCHGQLKFAARTVISSPVKNFSVHKRYFPEGIVRFTLLDNQYRPHCERLAYHDKIRQTIINVSPDKERYAPREKVTLNVSVRDSADKPVRAYLSLTAVDRFLLKGKEKDRSDIYSYFLLESEIHGRIEQPAYYFDNVNPDRLISLDLLLLTQGWRDFIWKHLNKPAEEPSWLQEEGISVSGKLRKLFTDKPIANATISLGIFGGAKPDIYYTHTDSSGRFDFAGLKFYGKKTLVASAVDKNNDLKGWLLIDTVSRNHPRVNYRWKERSEIITLNSPEVKTQKAEEFRTLKKYHLADTIMMDEVLITAEKKDLKKDTYFRIYGEPDDIIDVTDRMVNYPDIFQMMKGRISGVNISGDYPNISISIRGASSISLSNEPAFLVDGYPSDLTAIASIPVSDIEKIEIIKSGAALTMFGMNGSSGVISVFTRRGASGHERPFYHSVNKEVNGFYQARTFYSPKYDIPKPEYERTDFRSTLFWDPEIITDINGNATITFYNGDNITDIQVNTEGISESGTLVTGNVSYTISK